MLHALIFATITFVILYRAKYFGTKKAVSLWLERTVVDGLWLFDLTERPFPDFLRRSDAYADRFEILAIKRTGRTAPLRKKIIKTHRVFLMLWSSCNTMAYRAEGLPLPWAFLVILDKGDLKAQGHHFLDQDVE
jgi:hypothetical protein